MDLLKLLEGIEWASEGNYCPCCNSFHHKNHGIHDEDCALHGVLDAVRAGRLVVVEIGKRYSFTTTMNGELVEVEKWKEHGI